MIACLYALSATGDIRRLPLTHMAIIAIVVLYSLRALAGGISRSRRKSDRDRFVYGIVFVCPLSFAR